MNKLWFLDGVKDIYWDAFIFSTREALPAFRKVAYSGEDVSLLSLDPEYFYRATYRLFPSPPVEKRNPRRGGCSQLMYLVGIPGPITLGTAGRRRVLNTVGRRTDSFPTWSLQTTWKCPRTRHLAIDGMSQVPWGSQTCPKASFGSFSSLRHSRLRAKSHHSGEQQGLSRSIQPEGN